MKESDIDFAESGIPLSLAPMLKFTKTLRHDVYPFINPRNVTLAPGLVVCVLGASKGIGAHIALAYAIAGCSTLVITARKATDLNKTVAEIAAVNPRCKVVTQTLDLTSAADVSRVADFVRDDLGRCDIVIPCGGVCPCPMGMKIHETSVEDFKSPIDVNYLGTFHVAKYFVPLLRESKGGPQTFLAISSHSHSLIDSWYGSVEYAISKLAVTRLTEMIDIQYRDDGVFAMSLNPGSVPTDLAVAISPPEVLPYLADSVDLAGAVCVWLTKDLERKKWLGGRFLTVNQDMEEVEARKAEIVEKDLLKFRMTF